jgi:hypothetical protein
MVLATADHDMKYPDGTEARVGDVIRFASGATGVVVASMDTDEYSQKHPREQWSYLKVGVMIDCTDAGLIHYVEPEARMVLVSRAR